jgi:hypothetical protein
MRLSLSICLLVAVTMMLSTSRAGADVIYGYVTDQGASDVVPGGRGLVSSDLLAQNGLFSFDVAVDVTTAPSDPAAITASAANSDFNGVVNNVPPMIVIADRDLLELDGVQPVVVDANTYRILVATFTIEGGSVLGEMTTFSVADYENPLTPGADENTFYWDDIAALNPLDATIGAGSFSVTVMPEPATPSLLALGGLAVLRRRRREDRS